MKKVYLLLYIFVSFTFSDTNVCKTDVYFGNGVWNSYQQAEDGKLEIRRRLVENNIINQEDIALNDQDTVVQAYNLQNTGGLP